MDVAAHHCGPGGERGAGARRTALIAAGASAALPAVVVGMDPAGLMNGSGRSARDPWAVPVSPRPAADIALPGGGVSDGTRCGTEGFHHFEPAPASFTFACGPQSDAPPPGPQLVLSSYGFSRTSQKDPGASPSVRGSARAPAPATEADEAFLRYLKTELAMHVLADLTADEVTMWRRTEGIVAARTLVELRDFVRQSTHRPDWDFTTDRQHPAPPPSGA